MSEHASSDIARPAASQTGHQPARRRRRACDRAARHPALRADFERQGAFLYLDKFLAPDECAQLVALTAPCSPA
jgi:hypothetical protein